MIIELLSTFDLITDGYLLYKFALSRHTAWLCLNIQTVIWPFFISYVPFISYQIGKLRSIFDGKKKTCSLLRKLFAFFGTTPILLVYLFLIDAVFLVISSVLTPIFIVLMILTCGSLSLETVDETIDGMYK